MHIKTKIVLFSLLLSSAAMCAEFPLMYFPGLESTKDEKRYQTYTWVLEDREAKIKELMIIAERPGENEVMGGPVTLAIRLLGKFRAVEAVPVLVSRLTFLPRPGRIVSTEWMNREEYYPAAKSLIEIGEPRAVTSEMVEILSQPSKNRQPAENLRRDLAAYVLMEMYDKQQAADLLQFRANRLDDVERKSALMEAVKYIQNYKAIMGYPTDLTA